METNKSARDGPCRNCLCLLWCRYIHLLTRKILRTKYDEILAKEIAEAKLFYEHLHQKKQVKPEDLAAQYDEADGVDESDIKNAAEAIRAYQGEDASENKEDETDESGAEQHNVFVDAKSANSVFDYAVEQSKRDARPGEPYIISEEEFMQNDPDYTQGTLTWYDEDEVLVDDRDSMVPDIHYTIGDEALHRFGHGASSRDQVHVRNDQLEMDFEISKSNGSYTEQVAGFIKHSSDRPGSIHPRRMRSDDG